MFKRFALIALLFVAFGAPTVLRADITYTVDQMVGAGTAMGSITTNGTIGLLSGCPGPDCDIVTWDLTLIDGTDTVELTPSNSRVEGDGGDLTATATNLLFNFSGTDEGNLTFYDGPQGNELCYNTHEGDGCAGLPSVYIILDNFTTQEDTPESGTQVIASVTPEPATAILWLTGIGLMILMRKRLARVLRLETGIQGSLLPR